MTKTQKQQKIDLCSRESGVRKIQERKKVNNSTLDKGILTRRAFNRADRLNMKTKSESR